MSHAQQSMGEKCHEDSGCCNVGEVSSASVVQGMLEIPSKAHDRLLHLIRLPLRKKKNTEGSDLELIISRSLNGNKRWHSRLSKEHKLRSKDVKQHAFCGEAKAI